MSLLLLCVALLQEPSETLVLRGLVLRDPAVEPEEATVVLAGGRILKIAAEAEIPAGAKTLALPKGAWIVPGFVDAHSHLGSAWEAEEPTEPLTPRVKAVEGFATRHPDVRDALASGVTRVAIAPGEGNVVGGRVGLVHLNGERYDRALQRDAAGLKASLGEETLRRDREPTSRGGALRLLRDFLRSAPLEGPLFVHASTEGEIRSALALKADTGARIVLVHAREAAKAVDALRAAGVAVAFGPLTPHDPLEILATPGLLAKAGVPVALISDAPRTSEAQLRVAAILAVKAGMSTADALRALTTTPASLFGLSCGELKEGADADLVVWTGDPLSSASAAELAVVKGRVTFRRESP
ncbi:MAG TPA: amidohydrolase family protein [Planctomycetota bacterium]